MHDPRCQTQDTSLITILLSTQLHLSVSFRVFPWLILINVSRAIEMFAQPVAGRLGGAPQLAELR
jgi:hypothetical protein